MGIRSYAQNFEDVMLWRALGDKDAGFFIDVGAQHPIKDSVSKTFSENGWRGIHVEPTPEYANLLREDRPDDMVIQAVVSDDKGVVTFFAIQETGLSTGQRAIAEAHAASGRSYHEIAVPTLSLDDLLDLAPSDDIHWLKIDVEGMEHSVLASWRQSRRRPQVVIVEANLPGSQTPNHEHWEPLILEKGYHPVYYDGLNRFYVSDAHRELDGRFLTPPNIFDGFQFHATSDHAILIQRQHQSELDELESQVASLEACIANMRAQSELLEREWQAATEQKVLQAQDEAATELAREREWERSRAEAIVGEIHRRERDSAATFAAECAAMKQAIAALEADLETERTKHAAREADLVTVRKEEIHRLTREFDDKMAASEAAIAAAKEDRASLVRELTEARRKIGEFENSTIERERQLVARADRMRDSDAARFETRLSEERVLLLASEQRLSTALQQLHDAQKSLDQAHQAAAEHGRSMREQMDSALARLRAEAVRDAKILRAQAEQREERLQSEHHAAMVNANARLLELERNNLEDAKAHGAAILAQAEAFRVEIVQVREAAAEQLAQSRHRLDQAERRHAESLAATRAEFLARLSLSGGRINAITSSRSWRLTAPLRWLMNETGLAYVPTEHVEIPPSMPAPEARLAPTLPSNQGIATMTSSSAWSLADLLALPARDFVCESFRLLLGRDPSQVEHRARESALYLGEGRVAMLAEIHQSPEAIQYREVEREAGSDQAFIERAYQRYLGRAADDEGSAHYITLIQRKGRKAVERDLAASLEAVGNRSLPEEIERVVKAYRRSGSWRGRLSRTKWERRLRNIENEALFAQLPRHEARKQEEMQRTLDQMTSMASLSQKAVHALRDQGERALWALDARQKAYAEMAARRESEVRSQMDQARIETQEALALIRDDAQARFDRLVENYRAEQAAAAPTIQKVDASQLAPRAREILQRMQILKIHVEGGRG